MAVPCWELVLLQGWDGKGKAHKFALRSAHPNEDGKPLQETKVAAAPIARARCSCLLLWKTGAKLREEATVGATALQLGLHHYSLIDTC
jgi:hypothetical protein